MTHEPRSATAYALRDTHLAFLHRSSFDRLIAAYSQEMLQSFNRQMAERLRERNRDRRPRDNLRYLSPSWSVPQWQRDLQQISRRLPLYLKPRCI